MKKTYTLLLILFPLFIFSQNGIVTYQNGEVVDSIGKGVIETKLESLEFLNTDSELEESTSLDDIKKLVDITNEIFDALFKDSKKSGKIMIEFELLKKDKNTITFAVRDDLDLDIMKEFEIRIKKADYPKSKNKPIKLILIYKVNSLND
jgi:hypothetical protein